MRPFLLLFVFGLGVAAASPAVSITNATRGGSASFFDGDGFVISISGGQANSPVSLTQFRNGMLVNAGVPEGNTDSNGNAQFTGYVLGSEAGSWTETWYVGGVQANPALYFTIRNVTSVPILTPNTLPHDYYLFNGPSNIDIAGDLAGLPHLFPAAGALTDPAPGTTRGRCSLVTNPGTNYVPPGAFSWFFYNPAGPANGMLPLAPPGEYMESPLLSYGIPGPYYQTTGFSFNGEFIGQAAAPQTANQAYVESAYVSDRECFDGDAEYGWYRAPVFSDSGTSANQPPNVLTFYYSAFTNCHANYACEYADGTQVVQLSNFYTVTLNSPNAAGTWQFNFQAFRTTSNFGNGLVSSFVLSITDPETGAPAPCSVVQTPLNAFPASMSLTGVAFTRSGYCSEVFVGIDLSWYPEPVVTNTGYITFADASNTYFPESWFYNGSPAGNAPPTSNVVPTTYPNGRTASMAGFNIVSASEIYADEERVRIR